MRACLKTYYSFGYIPRFTIRPLRSPTAQRYAFIRSNFRRFGGQGGLPDSKAKGSSESWTVCRNEQPTIYALSTASGRAAIAIIRVSGSACLTVYQALCPGKPQPRPRHATLRTLYEVSKDTYGAAVLDAGALVLHFPAPDTATGEDVLEFHVHGGTAVVKAVLNAISKSIPEGDAQSIRYAEPGEFTRRAFYNNRLDLTQIEALGDTLSADTEQQRRLAVRASTSERANQYELWRQKLLAARGELEALIDFSEDQHFDESPAQLCLSVAKQVHQLKTQLNANIRNASRGELIRNGINIALVGAPNAGKSSLLNRIVGREAAIVSSEAGTTRDVVDVEVDIAGYFCKFGDLAGLRKSQWPGAADIGEIEKEGIRRAKERAFVADVVIVVLSAAAVDGPCGSIVSVEITPDIREILRKCDLSNQKIVCVMNKIDLFTNNDRLMNQLQEMSQHRDLKRCMELSETVLYPISCKSADDLVNFEASKSNPGGIQAFLNGLTQLFGRMTSAIAPDNQVMIGDNSTWAESLGANERQRILLQHCLEHLESFLAQVQPSGNASGDAEIQEEDVDIVLAAESLRSAADCLSKITGKGGAGDVEEVLGVVFEKYLSSSL